jgi:hypothetical protein
MMERKEVRKVLTDFSDVTELEVSILDIFQLPDTYRTLGLHGGLTEAVVCPAESLIRETVVFYETVCVNRGNNVRTFDQRALALRWLNS